MLKTKTLRELFNAWGIPILDNETLLLELNNQRINVAGVADLWTGKDDLPLVISKMEKNYPSILISHNPDIILREGHENFDLILSGYTHAGQIRLPYIGSVPNIPDELGRAYDMGLFKLKNGYLYISRGLGESGTRARLFSPPELSIITVE